MLGSFGCYYGGNEGSCLGSFVSSPKVIWFASYKFLENMGVSLVPPYTYT